MLRIVGDINLTDGYFDTGIGVGSKICKGLDPFSHLQRNETDYWMGNMECVCAATSCEKGLRAQQFIISPDHLGHIRHLNFYGVANNHVMQHGDEAYRSMLDYFDKGGIAYAGAESKRCHTFLHQGKRIGVVAFSMRPDNFTNHPLYWSLPEYDALTSELNGLAGCDFRIVYLHWGNEFIDYPHIEQKHLAHALVDMGAHLVIGMHPHRLQGFERYKDGTIFYSLGNFVFNMSWEPTRYSAIVNVDFSSGHPIVGYDYVAIGPDYCPTIVKEVPDSYRFEHLNQLLVINKENEVYYRKVFKCTSRYHCVNRMDIIKNFLRMKPQDSMGIVADFLKRKL